MIISMVIGAIGSTISLKRYMKVYMLKKYVILAVTAALLTPNFAVFGEDEDLQNQLSDVQNRMAQESEKKAQAEAVIGSVNDRLYAIQQQLEAAQRDYQAVANELKATEEKIAATQLNWKRPRPGSRCGKVSLPSASATSICTAN